MLRPCDLKVTKKKLKIIWLLTINNIHLSIKEMELLVTQTCWLLMKYIKISVKNTQDLANVIKQKYQKLYYIGEFCILLHKYWQKINPKLNVYHPSTSVNMAEVIYIHNSVNASAFWFLNYASESILNQSWRVIWQWGALKVYLIQSVGFSCKGIKVMLDRWVLLFNNYTETGATCSVLNEAIFFNSMTFAITAALNIWDWICAAVS